MIGFKFFDPWIPLFGPPFSAARHTYLCYLLTDFHKIKVILGVFDHAEFICEAKNAICYRHLRKNYQFW